MTFCLSKISCISNFFRMLSINLAPYPEIIRLEYPFSHLQFVRSRREAVRQCCFALRLLLTKRAENIWVIKTKFNLDRGFANLWTSRNLS